MLKEYIKPMATHIYHGYYPHVSIIAWWNKWMIGEAGWLYNHRESTFDQTQYFSYLHNQDYFTSDVFV